MSLAVPVSDEDALEDRGKLMRGGRRLLVSAGLISLAFFLAIMVIATFTSGKDQSLAILIGDYVVTLGIAVPGLTLFILQKYTENSMRKGNAMAFTTRAKVGLVAISWVVLGVAVVLLVEGF
jgi:hypothetical protein